MAVSLERPTRITELDAVNFMLRAIGESPVSNLTTVSKPSAVKAQQVLGEQSLAVQSEGWNFVVEEEMSLEPHATSGYIYLPESIAAIEPAGTSRWDRVQERGGRLYDPVENTYVFTEAVVVKATIALPFDQLPQPARWYIAVKSAIQLVNSEGPGSASLRVVAEDLAEAKRLLEVYDRRLKPGGLRLHNSFFKRMRGNR